MNSKRYERLREIFLLVCDLPVLEQEIVIKKHCLDDQTMQEELHKLLSMDAKNTGLLESATLTDDVKQRLADALGSQSVAPIPDRIGHYKIVKQIGGGGMGDVFEATQDNPKRTVAIKMIKTGVASQAMLKRFEYEAHVLGLLQHPGIAQIYEAGTADTGQGAQPYFAMELVEGVSLTDYAKQKNLGTRETLQLIADLSDAIQHAHSKGVVHRDLKPSNILITKDGRPKILDFGVARAIDSDIQTTTLQTDIGQLIGTIQYMSPEQAKGSSDEIDTRSDVYALGVLMFEVLARKLPYELSEKLIHEAVRVIREDDPTRLSSISTKFRGDIDTIVAKALEKEKDRRYQTAAELAADIRRYLNDEPIIARPASAMYQFHKFTQRNKALVGGVVAAFVILVLGIIGTGYGLISATTHQRDAEAREIDALQARAIADERRKEAQLANENSQLEARKATAVIDLLLDALSYAGPSIARGRQLTVIEVLDEIAERIPHKLLGLAEVQSSVYESLGLIFSDLGETEKALGYLRKAKAQFSEFNQSLESDVGINFAIARNLVRLRNLNEAEEMLRENLSRSRSELGADHLLTVKLEQELANLFDVRGVGVEAVAIHNNLKSRSIKLYGMKHPATIEAMAKLALALRQVRRFDEAEIEYQSVVELANQVLGEDHPNTLSYTAEYAINYKEQGLHDKALAMNAQVTAQQEKVLGEVHFETMLSKIDHADILQAMDRFQESEQIYRDLLVILEKDPSYTDSLTLLCRTNLCLTLSLQSKFTEAVVVVEPLYRKWKQEGFPSEKEAVTLLNNMALATRGLGNLSDAENLVKEGLDLSVRVHGRDHGITLELRSGLVILIAEQGDLESAKVLARMNLDLAMESLGESHLDTVSFMWSLADLLRSQEEQDEAEAIRRRVLEIHRRELGPTHSESLLSLRDLARHVQSSGRLQDAEALYRELNKLNLEAFSLDHPRVLIGQADLARCLMYQGRLLESVQLFEAVSLNADDIFPANHPVASLIALDHGRCLGKLGRNEDAESKLLAAYRHLDAIGGIKSSNTIKVIQQLVELYDTWGKPEKAAEYRALLEAAENKDEAAQETEQPAIENQSENDKTTSEDNNGNKDDADDSL